MRPFYHDSTGPGIRKTAGQDRIEGGLGETWLEYFGAQSMSVEVDEAGLSSTTLVSEPVDQAALVGMINLLNGLGLPVVSVECLSTPVEDGPSVQGDV